MSDISKMSPTSWIQLLILSIFWGGSFFFVELALRELPIFVIVFTRVFLGFILLFLFSVLTGRKFVKDKNIWLIFLIMGLLNNAIPFCMIVTGQRFISGGFASILNSVTPFITVILAHIFTTDEKITTNKIIGLICGIIGVTTLIGYNPLNTESNEILGVFSVLTASTSYAFAGVFGRRLKKYKIDPVVTSTGQLLCSSAILLPVMLILNKPWTLSMPSMNTVGAILGIALFSTSIAYILYFKILSSAGATNVLLVTFLVPISAVILGFLFLSESFQIRQGIGMFIIGCGLISIDGRLIEKIKTIVFK